MEKMFAMGWRPRISLEEGVRRTYEWFLANRESLREV
jgi:GDP-L-fucose synthase